MARKTTTTAQAHAAPAYLAWHVSQKGEKSYWNKVGAVWAHKDGKGFNLKLEFLPLNGAELTIREPKPKSEAATEASPAEFEGGFSC